MTAILRYKDENDKSLGLAGMAISLVACDCEEYLCCLSLEEGCDSFSLTQDFYVSANPSLSAKSVWNATVKQYQTVTGMLIGNVLCRAFAAGTSPSNDTLTAVRGYAVEEGAEMCALEADEVDRLFANHYNYYRRLFSHPVVLSSARDLAQALRRSRSMTAAEALDYLQRLNSL